MALLDYFGKKTAPFTNQITQQAIIHAEVSRLQGLITEQEKELQRLYIRLGKAYVAAHRENPAAEFADTLADVLRSEACIDDYNNQIRACKGITVCKACGAEIPQNTAFCSSCGARVEPPAGYVICENCGSRMEKGQNFCTECGAPLARPEAPAELCPNCGAELTEGAKFCSNCGTSLTKDTPKPVAGRVCTHYGTEAKPGSLFCTECGESLTDAPSAAQTILVQDLHAPRRCPSCGAELADDVVFCTECGKRL